MTREEAIEVIRKEYACVDADCDIERSCGKCELHMPSKEPILKAYEMAIQALSQEPCDDAISRQAVINAIENDCMRGGLGSCFASYNDAQAFRGEIEKLPSVTPKSESVTEFADKCRECGKNYVKIPDNATNGDVIKAMFPNIENQMIDLVMRCGTSVTSIGNDVWWNAPYQKGGKE